LVICRLLHRWAQGQAGLDLPWTIQLGPGFRIDHGWGLVINHRATIGANVTVFHGVTIGQKDDITPAGRRVTCPVIDDEVWIGPHAVIIGQVTVGRGSRVAAGAIVTHDVEPHCVVGGNPAKVIQRNALPDVWRPARISQRPGVGVGSGRSIDLTPGGDHSQPGMG
jgi:serine O-acetyltransferase